jgi:HAD superfamily hydrolase (TIGR01509 family)
MPIHAVLWDLDGVLTDSGDTHFQAWLQIFKPYGIAFCREDFRLIFGMNNAATLSRYFDPVKDADTIREIDLRKEALFREMIHGRLELFPGVLDWLTYFKSHGIHQAVASSAPQANIEVMIDELGIRGFFEALVSGAAIPGKPHPDVFLLAAQTVGVDPADCLVVEDAIAGVEAACRAGMKSVAVLTTSPAEALAKASLVINRLDELAPDRLATVLWPDR